MRLSVLYSLLTCLFLGLLCAISLHWPGVEAASSSREAVNTDLSFSEVSAAAGISMTHHTYTPIGLNMMISGAAAGDFNQDGWVDLFVLGGGTTADALYINNGDSTFQEAGKDWGIAVHHRGSAAAVGDFNADGWPDIFVTSHGLTQTISIGHHRLYRNNGDGTFQNIAEQAGVNTSNSVSADGFGAVFGDYDLDGDLDLYVTGWKEGENANRLYRNNGDETFKDVTEIAQVNATEMKGFSPCFADMDGDRYPELLVAADFDTSKYYVNNGDGTFTDRTQAAGVDKSAFGMGSTIADMNNDGQLDWYLTSIHDAEMNGEGNRLYLNQGNHQFQEVAATAGVDDGRWGWGTSAIDLDHDGWLDLVETNGWTQQVRFQNQPNRLWLNNGDGTYREVAQEAGFDQPIDGRGLLHLDFDNDGDQDIVLTANNGKVQLYRNDLAESEMHWLKLKLDTAHRHDLAPNGIGSRVSITVGDQTYLRYMDGCPTFLSQNEPLLHFGIGGATTIDKAVIEWPDGHKTELTNLPVDEQRTIRAPQLVYTPLIQN